MTTQNFINILRLFYNTSKTDEEIMIFLNSILRTIWRDVGKSMTDIIYTTGGVDEYELPSDCMPSGIKKIVSSEGVEYFPINLDKKLRRIYEIIEDDKIRFTPVTEQTECFKIYFTCFPEVESLVDLLNIKKDCVEVVKAGTIALIAKAENKITLANNYSHEFNELYSEIKNHNDEYVNGFPKVRDVNV
ncbi:hypothetical protein [Treponema sp. R6D11]